MNIGNFNTFFVNLKHSARIIVEPEKESGFDSQFKNIVTFVESLNEIDTKNLKEIKTENAVDIIELRQDIPEINELSKTKRVYQVPSVLGKAT